VLPVWLEATAGGVLITVHAQPGAKRAEVVGTHGDALKVRIAAPPIEGRANDALTEFFADRLGVPRRAVTLVSGESSRRKRLRVEGIGVAETAAKLAGAGVSAAG
jgi:uncharacterized protein (TIGR00251 family)